MTIPKTTRRIILVVAGVLLVGVIVVAASLISTQVQTASARSKFDAAETSVIHQVEADDNAHAALTTVQTSDFGTSVAALVSSLDACTGTAATATTTSGLTQLSGFSALAAPARDAFPLITIPSNTAGYTSLTTKLLSQLSADQARTAETKADTQANLIAQDEVGQDLYAIAQSIGGSSGTSVKLVSKDTYAVAKIKDAYKASVAAISSRVTTLAPALAAKTTIKFTPAQDSALVTALGSLATECKAEAASSKAHKPKPVVHSSGFSDGYPSWHLTNWFVFSVNIPNPPSVEWNTNAVTEFTCTPKKLLEEGTTSGKAGSTIKVPYLHTSVAEVMLLNRAISATTVQWAWVEC